MQKNNIELRQISLDDDMEGLKVLQNISNDNTNMNESPVPKEIDEYLYKGFLLLSYEEANDKDSPTIRYWVTLNKKIIGYADIKKPLDDITKARIGNIGLILLKEYRNKGIGLYILKLLIEKAKNELDLNDIVISTSVDNNSMRKLCEKMNGELLFKEDKCNYVIK